MSKRDELIKKLKKEVVKSFRGLILRSISDEIADWQDRIDGLLKREPDARRNAHAAWLTDRERDIQHLKVVDQHFRTDPFVIIEIDRSIGGVDCRWWVSAGIAERVGPQMTDTRSFDEYQAELLLRPMQLCILADQLETGAIKEGKEHTVEQTMLSFPERSKRDEELVIKRFVKLYNKHKKAQGIGPWLLGH
ncbi:hypothetical protein [Teichococcus vastitatis]|uniref:Uncharacterized protein n=1 Tax=Teichococcus vastitatis TaxID=2307076 RepID=A0ABS9WD36_9PROT|nr:hypothetical protein [Pseudoroseomonas vastitatis]MCI0756675.1 hypothetical protein [Pseudoroseomonas vastitatis]